MGRSILGPGWLSFNPSARRAYEKAGFRLDHVRHGAFTFDGAPVDEEVMVRTR